MKENEREVEPQKICENVENFKKYFGAYNYSYNADYDYMQSTQTFMYMVWGLKDEFGKLVDSKKISKLPSMVNLQGYAHVLGFVFSKVVKAYSNEILANKGKSISKGYVKVLTADIEFCTGFDYQAFRDYRKKLSSVGLLKFRSIGEKKSEVEYLLDMEAFHNLLESGKRIYEEKKADLNRLKDSRAKHVAEMREVVHLPEYYAHLDYSWDDMPDKPKEPLGVSDESQEYEEYRYKCDWALVFKVVHNATFFFNGEKFDWNKASVNSFKKFSKNYWIRMICSSEEGFKEQTAPLILGCSKKFRNYINEGDKQLQIRTGIKNAPQVINDTINCIRKRVNNTYEVPSIAEWLWHNCSKLCTGSIEEVQILREQAIKVLPSYLFPSYDND